MSAYGAVAIGAAFALRRWASRPMAPGLALQFLATSNISGLLLALIPRRIQPGQALAGEVNWAQSLPVLGIVASLAGASFLWARLRAS